MTPVSSVRRLLSWVGDRVPIRRLLRLDPLRTKRLGELRYWQARREREGVLANGHYAFLMTRPFGIERDLYDGARVLDLGCGPRGSLEWATGAAVRVGLDPLAWEYRRLGSTEHAMDYAAASASAIPFCDAAFDIVVSCNALDHVDALEPTVSEIRRVLRPGGHFLLMVDIGRPPTLLEPVRLSWESVARLFSRGFRPLRVRHLAHGEAGMLGSVRAARRVDPAVCGQGIFVATLLREAR